MRKANKHLNWEYGGLQEMVPTLVEYRRSDAENNQIISLYLNPLYEEGLTLLLGLDHDYAFFI